MQLITMSAQERTVETLGTTVTQELGAEYDLVHVYQGQALSDDVVNALVRGDNEWETTGGESLSQWADESRWEGACDAVDQLTTDIVRRWEREDDADYGELLDDEWPGSSERLSVIETVMERDRSGWFAELVTGHGTVLLRVLIDTMDEDASLSFTTITPEGFLDRLGFEHTDANLKLAWDVVANASPEHTVAIGYALIGVDLDSINDLPADGQVEIHNPHVWLGNPFAGSGWCDGPFTGSLVVNRSDLRTDADAFGCSWSEVVGGTYASYYAGGITTGGTDTEATSDAEA